jgi:hypothetical protein
LSPWMFPFRFWDASVNADTKVGIQESQTIAAVDEQRKTIRVQGLTFEHDRRTKNFPVLPDAAQGLADC